jgi:GTP-binding protein
MALVDEYRFSARAGKGGDGVVRWRREKFIPRGGPNGGDGGRGGDVYVEAVRDITMLGRILNKDRYQAQAGEAGGSNSKHGADGEDITIKLPIGSVITNEETGTAFELLTDNERVLLCKGGIGGLGNEQFKSATNRTPEQATKGREGEEGRFKVELRLIADVGIIGQPNAGKTSLLNALTNADAKVGAYPFTTLDPNLGVYQGYVLADIPGLIEGASEGKGLGHKFLRHISRTNVILHCISLEQDNISEAYDVVRGEIEQFEDIGSKNEYVVLTKTDMVEPTTASNAVQELVKSRGCNVLGTVSVLNDAELKELADKLVKVLRKET